MKQLKVVELNCPSSLDLNSKGFVTIAILGERRFRVTEIDPASVRLEGVPASGFIVEDVAGTSKDLAGRGKRNGSSHDGPDGINDLALFFDTQILTTALGNVQDQDVLVLELTGNLINGTPIVGEDIVTVCKQGMANQQTLPHSNPKHNKKRFSKNKVEQTSLNPATL